LRTDCHVSEADDLVDLLSLQLGEHAFESRQVPVDVCNQPEPHLRLILSEANVEG
jgi:hypothetical protein